MLNTINTFFLAQGGEGQAQRGGMTQTLATFLPFILIFAAMYFFMIRPQRRKEKKLQEELSKMTVGDRVMSIGGVVGRVVNISDDEVTVATSVSNTMITFKKTAINTIIKQEDIEKAE